MNQHKLSNSDKIKINDCLKHPSMTLGIPAHDSNVGTASILPQHLYRQDRAPPDDYFQSLNQ